MFCWLSELRNSALLTIGLAAMLIAAIVGSWYFYSLRSGFEVESAAPPAGEPLVMTVGFGDIETAIPSVGRVQFAELTSVRINEPGKLAEIYVDAGDDVDQGQLLALIERRTRPRFVEIPAPVAGTVMSISLSEGQPINPADGAVTILQIADTRLTVVAELYESDVAALDQDTDVSFTTVASGEREWTGTIRRIDPVTRSSGGQVIYEVMVDVDAPDAGLRAESTAKVFFVNRLARDVLMVPIGALTPVIGEPASERAIVEVVGTDGVTESREIVTGVRDRINAEVVSGLEEGERIIAGSELAEVEYEPFPFEPPADLRRFREAPDGGGPTPGR